VTDSSSNVLTETSVPVSFDAANRSLKVSTISSTNVGIHQLTMTAENPLLSDDEPNKYFSEAFSVEIVSGINPPPFFTNLADSV